MKVILAACLNNQQMNHSLAVKMLLSEALSELCIAIGTYCAGFNDE
jgi:hypothetical protein